MISGRGGVRAAYISGLASNEAPLDDAVNALGIPLSPEDNDATHPQDDHAVTSATATDLSLAASAPVSNLDLGFRVFKIDSSNKNPTYSVSDYKQDLLSQFESAFKADRSDLDLFFGCLLDYRLPLDRTFATIDLAGHTAYVYDHGDSSVA